MTALRELGFSDAKSSLSAVMDDVVHEHRPQLVQRHKGREVMLLVNPEDARRWLNTFRFTLSVVLDEGEVAVSAAPVGALGIGGSLDEALDDLVEELQVCVEQYFERPHFYAQTDVGRQEPWLLRFALTAPSSRRALLEEDIEAAAPQQTVA